MQKSIEGSVCSLKTSLLRRIPGHYGVAGNEVADYLAKQGISILQTSRNAIIFDNIKLLIKEKIKSFVLNQNCEL